VGSNGRRYSKLRGRAGVKMSDQDSISWGELAELTHATQVERFGWCICEDTDGEGQLHDDCPREG